MLAKMWLPTDTVWVPQGYGRLEGADVAYDPAPILRPGGAHGYDEVMIRDWRALDLRDRAALLRFADSYCDPADDSERDWCADLITRSLQEDEGQDTAAEVDAGTLLPDWFGITIGRRLEVLPDELVIRELQDLDTESTDEVLEFINVYGMVNLDLYRVRAWEVYGLCVPMIRVQTSIYAVQQLAAHFLADQLGGNLVELWRNQSMEVDDDQDCWDLFYMFLDQALVGAHAHPQFGIAFDDEVCPELPRHDLVDALVHQLAALIHSNLTVRLCAFEGCRRPFVRQRGRSRQGQYRTRGVKYCRPECANAQAQRQSRRRRAQELATTA